MEKYKVFLADDEAAMRDGVRNNIDWDNSKFVLAGEAPDGEMALPLMQEILPDILITDIRMPFMDGIELSEKVKKTMPWIKIVILSGHDEFEYAKQAITIGVEEYLLKPVTSVQLMKTLDEIAERIEAEKAKLINMGEVDVQALVSFTESNKPSIVEQLRYISKKDIPKCLDGYFKGLISDGMTSFLFMNYVFVDILVASRNTIEEFGGDASELMQEYSDISKFLSTDLTASRMKATLTDILEKTIDFRNAAAGSKHDNTISKAKKYIQENFAQPDISLHTVAEEVNVSPNHFSTIFRQETGETFINYITKIRMEKAKYLLATTSMRTSDVGYEVGYNDTHYFSYAFKRNTGMTPKEFRNKNSTSP
jgi:Response regulator containing CheY-like receiver domain and AraC-type DNA-binding domain